MHAADQLPQASQPKAKKKNTRSLAQARAHAGRRKAKPEPAPKVPGRIGRPPLAGGGARSYNLYMDGASRTTLERWSKRRGITLSNALREILALADQFEARLAQQDAIDELGALGPSEVLS